MRNWKSLVGALLLTMLLIGLALLNGAEPLNGTETFADSNSGIGEAEIGCAAAGPFPEIRIKKAKYDDDGNLIGCFEKGNNCVVIVFTVAGRTQELLVTADDVMLK